MCGLNKSSTVTKSTLLKVICTFENIAVGFLPFKPRACGETGFLYWKCKQSFAHRAWTKHIFTCWTGTATSSPFEIEIGILGHLDSGTKLIKCPPPSQSKLGFMVFGLRDKSQNLPFSFHPHQNWDLGLFERGKKIQKTHTSNQN